MTTAFEGVDWKSALNDLGCEDSYLKFLEIYHVTCFSFIKTKREWKAKGEEWFNYEVRNLIKENDKLC